MRVRNKNRHKTFTDTPKMFSTAHSKIQQDTTTKAQKPCAFNDKLQQVKITNDS